MPAASERRAMDGGGARRRWSALQLFFGPPVTVPPEARMLAEPTNSEVRLVITSRERIGREEFVQRICDEMDWVAIVDLNELPPRPRGRLFFTPRSIDNSARQ